MTASSSLNVTTQNLENDNITLLTLQGALDSHTYNTLESKIDRLIHHGDSRIILDLAGVDFLSSAGVRVFITARAKARNERGHLVFMNPSEHASQVIEALHLRENLTFARDLPEAMTQCLNP
jgi:anti-anti-sigma factor